jgi:predicted RNase H-like nuclease (RuvC/YqgF family)
MINAALYYPERDLSVSEKSEIAIKVSKEQGVSVKDPHMRDALAAAYKSFIQLKPKLDRIEEEVRRAFMKTVDDVKALVIKGMSIKQAIDEVSRKIEVQSSQEVRVIQQGRDCDCKCEDIRKNYEETIKALNSEIERLKRLYNETKSRVEELLNSYDSEARRDNLVRSLSTRLEILENDLEKYKRKIVELESALSGFMKSFVDYIEGNKYALIKHDENMSIDFIAQARNIIPVMTLGELMDIGIDRLINVGISSVILIDISDKNVIRPLWKRGLRVIPLNLVYKGSPDNVMFIDKSIINNTIELLGKEFLSAVDEDYLRRIVNEYRRLRNN